MFSEKMNGPVGICISQNTVFVTQWGGHCINMYELECKLIKSVGSKGNGEAQFNHPSRSRYALTETTISRVCD